MVFEASAYNTTGWPRPGGASVASQRESTVIASSVEIAVNAHSTVIGDVSSVAGGGPNDFWVLYGMTACASGGTISGYITDTGITHTSNILDEAVKLFYNSQKEGPFVLKLDNPIKFTPGAGMGVDSLGTPTSHTLLTFYFQRVRVP